MTTPINQGTADVAAGNYDRGSAATGTGGPFTALAAVAVTTTGAVIDLGDSKQNVTMEVIFSFTIAPTSTSTQLQVSEDGVNFTNAGSAVTGITAGVLGTASTTAGGAWRYARAATTIVVGPGTGLALTAVVAAR